MFKGLDSFSLSILTACRSVVSFILLFGLACPNSAWKCKAVSCKWRVCVCFYGMCFYGLCFYGLCFYGLCFYGLCFYGLCFYDTFFYGTCFYDACFYEMCFYDMCFCNNVCVQHQNNLMSPLSGQSSFYYGTSHSSSPSMVTVIVHTSNMSIYMFVYISNLSLK